MIDVVHLGDITKINGAEIAPVDVITFGAPCQDLSIAGLRKGIKHKENGDVETTRSGLFLDAVRVIKEMRKADVQNNGRAGIFVRPRYAVYENVTGAFSSNKGADFQIVLSEIVRIAEPDAPDVPVPEKGWTRAGVLMGDGWSVAWRVLDAQYWGVPQRRRRIALVADFGGHSAGEILFDGNRMSWDSGAGGSQTEGITGDAESCAYPPIARRLTARHDGSYCVDREPNIVVQNAVKCLTPWDVRGKWHSMNASESGGMQRDAVLRCVIPIHDKATRYQGGGDTRNNDGSGNGMGIGKDGDPCPTLSTADHHAIYDARGNGDGKVVCTLTGDHANRVTDYTALLITAQGYGDYAVTRTARTLRAGHDIGDLVCASVVRRLTPLECERLQGFPCGWTDIGEWTDSKGKVHKTSDSARYKALGNSIALPPWKWVLKRISAQYERDATLGSLFDGIGGFPLIWERLNGACSCLWASEIEEFTIAVSKRHFGDGSNP